MARLSHRAEMTRSWSWPVFSVWWGLEGVVMAGLLPSLGVAVEGWSPRPQQGRVWDQVKTAHAKVCRSNTTQFDNIWHIKVTTLHLYCSFWVNPWHICILSQWFLNLLPNQDWAAQLAAQDWFGREFKNH